MPAGLTQMFAYHYHTLYHHLPFKEISVPYVRCSARRHDTEITLKCICCQA
jgi:hypothetical protein